MIYDPPIKLYYIPNNGTISEDYRIVPAPQIDIKPDIYYANDIVIGYTYLIDFNGYATALDLRNPSNIESSLSQTLDAIKNIKTLFSINNGTLIITYKNQEILRANGGVTKNISFSNSENNWVNYAPYSISIEFNELATGICDELAPIINCTNIPQGIVPSPQLIEMQKYRIQSFKDGWSFNLDDNILIKDNQYFNIEYNVSAVGKHYFHDNQLLPAWEQAKNFCQYRLLEQISRLTSTALESTYTNCLTNGQNLASLFSEGDNGSLKDIDLDVEYGIFNETISSSASEASGSFDLTYKAIIKIKSNNNCIHTYSINKTINDDSQKIVTYTVDGEIKGLIPGGLIKSDGKLILQNQNELFIENNNGQNSKYQSAIEFFQSIGNDSGLNSSFISDKLQITYALFLPEVAANNCDGPSPKPTSFSTTHDYNAGIIKYTAIFDGNKICNQINQENKTQVTLSIDDSVPMIAEFIIPGRKNGPIIQLLDVKTPKIYNFSIQGIPATGICNSKNIDNLISKYCAGSFDISIPSLNFNNMILMDEKYGKSSDGSYSLTRKYIELSQ